MDHLGAAASRIRSIRRRLDRGNEEDAVHACIKAIRHLTKALLQINSPNRETNDEALERTVR